MAILNRDTLKQKISDFINRVAPFTNPLIQKTEDLEIRSDVADSVIFKESTVGSIGAPGGNFNVDFATNDEYNISTAASIGSAFNITLQNLRNNSVGKLNIIKKTGDTFSFANGIIVPFNNVLGQAGTGTISFSIFKIGSSYFAIPLYNFTSQPQLIAKLVDIGVWNMDTTGSVNVAHGLDFTKIRNVTAYIRIDGGGTIYNLIAPVANAAGPDGIQASIIYNNTNVVLSRELGQFFDASFFSGSANRGFVKIEYLA